MNSLAEEAIALKGKITRSTLRPVNNALMHVMILIANDVAQYNNTGRTPDDTLRDAIIVMCAMLDTL